MSSAIKITRETEFYQGYIRLKMAVTNESPYIIADVILDFIYDDKLLRIDRYEPNYQERRGKLYLGSVDGGKSKSIAIYFDPMMCSKGTDIDCHVTFKDYQGKRSILQMEPKEISVVCPIMKTESDINIGRLKEFINELPSRDNRVCEILRGFDMAKVVNIAREVVEKHDIRHVRTLHTKDENNYELWYYGKTKVNKDDIVIRISIFDTNHTVELFAATQTAEALTGLLAEIGRKIKEEVELRVSGRGRVVNISINKSKIDRSNLLDLCNMDGTCDVNIVLDKSVIDRSNVSSSERHEKNLHGHDYTVDTGKLHQAQALKKPQVQNLSDPQEQRIGKKALLFPVLIIIVLAGYWMFSSLLVVNSGNQDTIIPQNTKVVDSPLAANETNNVSTDNKTATTNKQLDLETYTNSIGMEFVLIPAGEFQMGSPSSEEDRDDDEGLVHEVTIENAYYLGKYEVTQAQWVEIMGNNPLYFDGDNKPVEQISWNEVQEFVKKLNAKEGTDKYRLPSEAEWEYACRAGAASSYSFGDDESKLEDYAWYCYNSGNITHPVGQKKPNPWGLYDMHGNVWEWCQDRWHDTYENAPTDGSAWENGNSSYRVSCGGSFFDTASGSRSAVRFSYDPSRYSALLGFRLLRAV